MNGFFNIFRSLKLTVALLALSMVLVLAGTLAQVEKGIWAVMDQYFRCFIAWIDLYVFFPRHLSVPDVRFPFPGGFLLGFLLTINLLFVHMVNFKVVAVGRRRVLGVVLLLVGLLVTVGVMLGWGTAPVASSEGDAFWRVFLRLGRGTLAAVILYAACQVLYRQRAGMVLTHAGIIFLLVGEFFTAIFAVEANMTIREGETVNYIDQSQVLELAFIDTSSPEYDTVTSIPHSLLRNNEIIKADALPFDVKIHRYIPNSNRPKPLGNVSEEQRAGYPEYQGYGSRLFVAEINEVSGAGRNAPAVDAELFDRATGTSLGRYILSLWFYPNFVNRAWDMPTNFRVGDQYFTAYFRFKREYLKSNSGNPYSIKLLDFIHEKYEGTQMPKDFSSQILLLNPGDGIDRELRIWMNNPLRYARRTFYQSGYLPGDKGTVLQVVRNDTWMIPYLSCMIVFVGMTAHFCYSLSHYLRRDS
ncbi:MAG TPA: cytochrome c biogenesis protein ResB [Pontiella sp.]